MNIGWNIYMPEDIHAYSFQKSYLIEVIERDYNRISADDFIDGWFIGMTIVCIFQALCLYAF